MVIFDGKKLAREKEAKLADEVSNFKKKTNITPKLVSFLVGDDPASHLYTKIKQKTAERVGMEFTVERFPSGVDPTLFRYRIREENEDRKIHGIMVQLPLPKESRIMNYESRILGVIEPKKDVDCLTPENLGLLMMGKPRFLPATVKGILTIVQSSKCKVQSQNVVIVGGSNIVGKPLAIVLSNLGATVTLCRSKTKDLGEQTRKADILISATGVMGIIKKEMVKPGAVVIDVGSPKGDVDFEKVKEVASFITPVPGGVGPLTVVSLLENTFQAAIRSDTDF